MTSDPNPELAAAITALIAAVANAKPADSQLPKTLLTVPEAAERLRIGQSSVRELLRRGEIKSLKLGKRRLIPTTEVDRIIDSAS